MRNMALSNRAKARPSGPNPLDAHLINQTPATIPTMRPSFPGITASSPSLELAAPPGRRSRAQSLRRRYFDPPAITGCPRPTGLRSSTIEGSCLCVENSPSQNTNSVKTQKINTLNDMTFAANPIVWVKAHGELSLNTSIACQNNRTEERIYPINAINQVNDTANAKSPYWERTEILPHSTGPVSFAPLIMALLRARPTKRQVRVPITCGTERPTRTFAGM